MAGARRRLTAALIALTLAPLSAFAAPLVPCKATVVRPDPAPPAGQGIEGYRKAPANSVGCLFGARLRAEAGVELWRCLVDNGDAASRDDAWSHAFLLVRPGKPVQAFKDELMAGEMGAFHLLPVDLDGDGRRENVVALWNSQGTGLGVNRWTVRVFDKDWKLLGQRDEVTDWGPSNLVTAPAGRKGCDLAVTAFVEDAGPPREGIALEARFLRLRAGRLVDAADRKPVRRRFTYAFQRQRAQHSRAREGRKDGGLYDGDIVAWLNAGGK
ncbi:MAG: hypothetical protein BGN86_16905 [Caulobacterales bacterium 68-7]|mgnify:CR=1 FL=1|nr:MAG: hypothetical protein BGN86_16905 [Caulobacterales bacterium 68-7]